MQRILPTHRQGQRLHAIRKEVSRTGSGMVESQREDGVIVLHIETPVYPSGIRERTLEVDRSGNVRSI